jgi:hypothetical protein
MQQVIMAQRIQDLLLRGVTWSMVGVFFGTLFVVLVEIMQMYLPFAVGLVVATISAAALTSLFYGSMRLALMVANFTFMATLIYTWQGAPYLGLEPLVLVGAGVGVAVGTAYGLHDKRSRIYCAEAKIVAGAFAGAIGGLVALLTHRLFGVTSYTGLAVLIAPIAVLVYVTSATWFIKRCHRLLPAAGNGAIVGLGVGTVTGLVFLIIAATLDPKLLETRALTGFVQRVEVVWMATVAGCAMACFPIGALRAVLNVPWYDH